MSRPQLPPVPGRVDRLPGHVTTAEESRRLDALDAALDRRLSLIARAGGKWICRTEYGSILHAVDHAGYDTQEEAIEAAVASYDSIVADGEEKIAQSVVDYLVTDRLRQVTVDDGQGGTTRAWQALDHLDEWTDPQPTPEEAVRLALTNGS